MIWKISYTQREFRQVFPVSDFRSERSHGLTNLTLHRNDGKGLITQSSLFKYTENFTTKKWKFSDKNSGIFFLSSQNIDCGYSLEPHRRGGSNEYPQSIFWAEIRKIMYAHVNPVLTI